VRASFCWYEPAAKSGTEMRYACGGQAEKIKCRAALAAWVHEDCRQLGETFLAYDLTWRPSIAIISWMTHKLRGDLARNPLVTVGIYHVARGARGVERRRGAAGDGGAYLQSHVDRQILHFADPCGGQQARDSREFELARDLGIRGAVTTRERHSPSERRSRVTLGAD
jgi:hypothetical protein